MCKQNYHYTNGITWAIHYISGAKCRNKKEDINSWYGKKRRCRKEFPYNAPGCLYRTPERGFFIHDQTKKLIILFKYNLR